MREADNWGSCSFCWRQIGWPTRHRSGSDVPFTRFLSSERVFGDKRLWDFNQRFTIFGWNVVLRREDFCLDDWEDTVPKLMCVSFDGHRLMSNILCL